MNNEIQTLIEEAANPHLIGSAKEANLKLARLNSVISELRLEVSELELKSDLHLNELMQEQGTMDQKKAKHKVSDIYREYKVKHGLLSDIRAIRRNLERHADLLWEQEKYKPKNYGDYPRVI